MIAENNNKRFTQEELDWIKEAYKTMSRREIALKLGRTSLSIKSIIKHLGVKKTRAELASIYRKTPKATSFKKGNKPMGTVESGSISVRMDHVHRKNPKAYYWIKQNDGKWQMLHIYLWTAINGKPPKGHVIRFKDGNSLNPTIENLELITMRENRILNSASTNLTDLYVAFALLGRGEYTQEKAEDIINNNYELIEIKRTQLLLNKEIKNHEQTN